jgi:hypothetical protein
MRGMARALVLSGLSGLSVALAAPCLAQAQTVPPDVPPDATDRAHEAFERGVRLFRDEQWAAALAAFREAAAAREHPRVEYNIAYCEQALGHYAAAVAALQVALADQSDLDAGVQPAAIALLAVCEHAVVHLSVTLDPPSAALAVDGLPLIDDGPDALRVAVEQPGPSSPVGRSTFALVLDPGRHVFHASRSGHADVDIERTYAPGARETVDLRLDLLPATVSIRSDPSAASVFVGGRMQGFAPIEIERPAGTYRIEVAADRYDKYASTVALQPGQRLALTAKLNPERDSVLKAWWFWTGLAAALAGGVVATYELTRPAPQPPPYETGSANWLVHTQGLGF